MKWAVLGAGGCFGQNLVAHLLSLGHEVIGIGRSPKKPECFSLGIEYPYYAYHIGYELQYVMNVLDDFQPHVICSFAAQGEGAASFDPRDYWRFYETNCVALTKLVGYLEERNCYGGRFIQVGTSELYGSVEDPAKEDAPIKPSSPYAASKAAFDWHLEAIHKANGFPMNILRPSNAFCRGQQLHRVIPRALLCAAKGEKLPLHGGGKAKKSYLHADDLSRAIVLVADNAPLGEIYNCGPDHPISIADLVWTCATIAGVAYADLVQLAGERHGQDACYWIDSTKLKALGWLPEVTLDQGIRDVWQWIQRYEELKGMSTSFVMRA